MEIGRAEARNMAFLMAAQAVAALGWPRYGAFLLRAGAVAAIAVVATR